MTRPKFLHRSAGKFYTFPSRPNVVVINRIPPTSRRTPDSRGRDLYLRSVGRRFSLCLEYYHILNMGVYDLYLQNLDTSL